MQSKLIIATAVSALLLAGCGISEENDDTEARIAELEQQLEEQQEVDTVSEEEEVVEEPEEEEEPEVDNSAEHGSYGSDEHFDALYDECEAGDMDACDELFWDSPLDSEYEAFALDMKYPSTSGNTTNMDDGLQDVFDDDDLLEYAWNTLDQQGQQDLCWGFNYSSDSRTMVMDVFMESSDNAVNRQSAENFFEGKC